MEGNPKLILLMHSGVAKPQHTRAGMCLSNFCMYPSSFAFVIKCRARKSGYVHTRGSKEGVEQHSYVLLSGVVGMPPKRAEVSRQPADAISEVLNS